MHQKKIIITSSFFPEHLSDQKRFKNRCDWTTSYSWWGCGSNIRSCRYWSRRWVSMFCWGEKKRQLRYNYNSYMIFYLLQVLSAWRNFLKVHNKIHGCSVCWSWTWTLLDGYWHKGEKVHISEVSDHLGLWNGNRRQTTMDYSS